MFKQMREMNNGEIQYFYENIYGLDGIYYPELIEFSTYNNAEKYDYDLTKMNSITFKVGRSEVKFHKGFLDLNGKAYTYLKNIPSGWYQQDLCDVNVVFFRTKNDKITKISIHTHKYQFDVYPKYISISDKPRAPRIPLHNFQEENKITGYLSKRTVKGNLQYLIHKTDSDGMYALPNHKVLTTSLDLVDLGSPVKILYLGKRKGKNGFEYNNYSVFVGKKQPQESLFNFQ